jgi:hypothetical protein
MNPLYIYILHMCVCKIFRKESLDTIWSLRSEGGWVLQDDLNFQINLRILKVRNLCIAFTKK